MTRFALGMIALSVAAMLWSATAARAQDVEPASPVPVVIASAGGVAILAGGLFALLSSSASSSAADAATHADAWAALGDAQTFSHVANAMLVTGAALAVLGIGWFTVELTRAERHGASASARLELGPGSLSLRGAF